MSSRVKALFFLFLWCHIFLIKLTSIVSLSLDPILVSLGVSGIDRQKSHFSFSIPHISFSSAAVLLLCFAISHFLLCDASCSMLDALIQCSVLYASCKKLPFSVKSNSLCCWFRCGICQMLRFCKDLRPFFWLAPFAVTATPRVWSKTSGLLVRFSTDWIQEGGVETRIERAPGWTWVWSVLKQ